MTSFCDDCGEESDLMNLSLEDLDAYQCSCCGNNLPVCVKCQGQAADTETLPVRCILCAEGAAL